jgi:ATP-dependent helicase/nuclease subunit A
LQGAVDCWFQEDGGVVIVDYKSDRVTAEEVPERAALYAPQIRAYALAMAAVTGKKVRETVLYFLRPGIAFSDGKNP